MDRSTSGGADWRTRASRRPSNLGGATRGPKPIEPPTMSRSRVQIATSYAPGVLLTWEGGKGICRSVPLKNDITKDLSATTIDLIFENIREFVTNWRDRVRRKLPDAPDEFILDQPFRHSRSGKVSIERQTFQMTAPDRVGYVPYPLLYRCGVCGSTRDFDSIEEQARRPLPRKCNGHDTRWTQVDVVYVHWSGNLKPLSPFNYNFDATKGEVRQIRFCTCGSQRFRLRNEAPVFSEWRYVCEGCGDTRALKKADPEVLHRLQSDQIAGGKQFKWIEVNMLPISYRANSAFYPQRTNFIEFQDSSVVELMSPDHRSELMRKLADIHNIPFDEPTDETIRKALEGSETHRGEWDDYQTFLSMAARNDHNGRVDRARTFRSNAAKLREDWFVDGIVERGELESPGVVHAVRARAEWTQRYDPIRLTVQHDAFAKEHIEEAMTQYGSVDVMEPDLTLTDVAQDPEALASYRATIGNLLSHVGVAQLVLVRGLPICEFSFGYTRVSSTPIYKREHQGNTVAMPVRLKAFDQLPVRGPKHPVYVTQQRNEALYFRLQAGRVRRWLLANKVKGVPDYGLGRAYLEEYADFGPFLEDFRNREGTVSNSRTIPVYVYLLLHSLAHQMMHSLGDTSGVDRDGIGEHIFPADLSFVIYRKGMTPDLGNVSAMWRNNAQEFLHRALEPRMLRCGSGSLCDARGGACPACIMVSEVSCIASNILLSRATLKGGRGPEWESAEEPDLIGFFDPSLELPSE